MIKGEWDLHGLIEYTFSIDLHLDTYKTICFKLGVVLLTPTQVLVHFEWPWPTCKVTVLLVES